ncbi:hypothetical protein [Ammoniphilus sp. CFH 90114]|uniref:hypothetical protein n=1 Tax=Ammoniphilus sp. CFH 90114 TaxID=2493665 RepID=UPI00100FD143|nr:hypothetical protein [Ammoniphilus sp. CFH 90114]RXT14863.1 hypothetical protein EIZ39_01230 [Ammoniphilus sp. CFH 90114]
MKISTQLNLDIEEIRVINNQWCELTFSIYGYDRKYVSVLKRFIDVWRIDYISPIMKENEPMVDQYGCFEYYAFFPMVDQIIEKLSHSIANSYLVSRAFDYKFKPKEIKLSDWRKLYNVHS